MYFFFKSFQFIKDETNHEKAQQDQTNQGPSDITVKPKEDKKKKKEDKDDKKKKKTGDENDKKKKSEEEKKKTRGKKTAVEPSPSSTPPVPKPMDPTGSAVSLRSNTSTVKGLLTFCKGHNSVYSSVFLYCTFVLRQKRKKKKNTLLSSYFNWFYEHFKN